ncbi:general negative regulator of transcription subunit 5 [Kappamyces sp. JEL0680]|nr:general negative regulator of transcription subunit 5 [Kappamyces sp. JEL0680]
MDPEELHKEDIRKWISDQTDTLETQIDVLEAEKEQLLLSGKKSKKVDTIKDDIMYYIDENQDPDFEENEFIYEDLNLEDAEVYFGNEDDEDEDREEEKASSSKKEEKKPSITEEKAVAKGAVTPRKSSKTKEEVTPKAVPKPASAPVPAPAPVPAKPTSTPRASIPTPVDAPVPPVTLRYAAAAAISIPKSETASAPSALEPLSVQGQSTSSESSTLTAAAKLKAATEKRSASLTSLKDSSPSVAAVLLQTDTRRTDSPGPIFPADSDESSQFQAVPTTPVDPVETKMPPALADLVASFEATRERARNPDRAFFNSMVDLSFLNLPDAADSSKLKTYFPQNPYPVPGYYPQTPVSVFTTTPAIFERFDTDTLFFIFYYRPGTFQQALAARELKRQSWRFHKHHQTWFQRHEEPQEVNENYEQGTYIYFDFEKTWTQRKKNDFSRKQDSFIAQDADTLFSPRRFFSQSAIVANEAAPLDPKIEKIVEDISKLNLLEAAALVSALKAKKFVESAPKVIKDNVPKDEAEKIKALLEAVGATVVLG